MQDARQDLDPLHEPGRRTAEVRVCVYRPHPPLPDRRKVGPTGTIRQSTGLFDGPRRVEAAGHEDENLRRSLEDLVPGETRGGLALSGEELLPLRKSDHLRDPVPGGERRVEPLYATGAWWG